MVWLRNSLTYVWLLLAAITLVSWWISQHSLSVAGVAEGLSLSFTVTVGIVLISFFKTRLIIWHFMEVREGPAWLRWTCDFWLAFLAVTLLLLYRYSL